MSDRYFERGNTPEALLTKLKKQAVANPRAHRELVYMSLKYLSVRGSESPETEMLWGILLRMSNKDTSMAVNLARYAVHSALGLSGKGDVLGDLRTDEFSTVVSIVDIATGNPSDQLRLQASSAGQPIVRLWLGHLVKLLKHIDHNDLADRLTKVWALWEHGLRTRSSEVVVHDRFFEAIGHFLVYGAIRLAEEFEILDRKPLIHRRPSQVSNAFLYHLFQDRFGMKHGPAVANDRRYIQSVNGNIAFVTTDKKILSVGALISQSLDRHFARSGAPIVDMGEEDQRRCRQRLSASGIDPDRPVVTVHVRETGNGVANNRPVEVRDARFSTYLKTIRFLIANGYQVIRLGDPAMTPAGDFPGFFDYPFSTIKSDMMDVYLAKTCAFHIGTSSGMSHVPLLFDKRILYTNWLPFGEYVHSRKTLTIVKRFRGRDGTVFSLDYADKRFRNNYESSYFKSIDADVLDNTEDEILAATRDLLKIDDSAIDRSGPLSVAIAPSFRMT